MRYEEPGHEAFKGVQSPLVFQGFKGKYIYIAAAFLVAGFLIAAFLISTVNVIAGGIALFIVWAGGFVFVKTKQKSGLHSKDRSKGTFIVVNKYKIRKLE